ncbi:MAG: ribosome biogenesis GTP-binding protein YihA/YsxC [Flavobacteriales bacterium]|nr:ribosome biogenesis GTP-binding protein YihA/YsxC [Flavobacteriales bacterium]
MISSFLKSSAKLTQCPNPDTPEYAFVGRSNVGKSSLINMILGRKDLAKTSGRPGKTQLINHFSIEYPGDRGKPSWYLVDLPGYGYAKVSKSVRDEFKLLINPYLQTRENLLCTFVLIDVRHNPQGNDLGFMEWLGEKGIPFAMVFTKADKEKPAALKKNIELYIEEMLTTWEAVPPYFVTSATKGTGRDEILAFIKETNELFAEI